MVSTITFLVARHLLSVIEWLSSVGMIDLYNQRVQVPFFQMHMQMYLAGCDRLPTHAEVELVWSSIIDLHHDIADMESEPDRRSKIVASKRSRSRKRRR